MCGKRKPGAAMVSGARLTIIRVPKIWDTRIYDFRFTNYELRISG